MAIDGDTLVVAAHGDDDGGDGAGSAYIFTRSGSAYVFEIATAVGKESR